MAKAYVTNVPGDAVHIINVQTNKVVGNLSVPLPGGIALSRCLGLIYVTSQSGNNLWVFSTKTRKLIRRIRVGKSPVGVAVTPNGNRVWVVNSEDNTVSVINARTNRVILTLPTGDTPTRVAVSPNGRFVYVSNSKSNTVSIYNALSNRPTAVVDVGASPGHMAFTPDGKRAYVVNEESNSISVIRTSTKSEIARISLQSTGNEEPYGIAAAPSGKRVFVTEFLDALLAVSVATNQIVRNLTFSDETTGAKAPQGIAVWRNNLYMVASANDQVEVRGLPSLRVVATIDIPTTLESEQGLQEIVVG